MAACSAPREPSAESKVQCALVTPLKVICPCPCVRSGAAGRTYLRLGLFEHRRSMRITRSIQGKS
eukprot:2475291-Pleurochrysis_carterae.AAC.5